jgi:RecB family exonuclease
LSPISPRKTHLVRAPDLAAFRDALVSLATAGSPFDARDRLVIVPTRAAAAQLVRSIERRRARAGGAVLLPDLITARELIPALASRLPASPAVLSDVERETLMGTACREAAREHVPPFHLRPGIVAAILELYDGLRDRQKSVDAFERLALGRLEPGADLDRGAARLVQQTHFLVAAFRAFERRAGEAGADLHALRTTLLAEPAVRPYRHAIITVGDEAFDRYGLRPADWDLLARLPGLLTIDVVTTDLALAGAPHERMHHLMPGIEEIRIESSAAGAPILYVADESQPFHLARDREDELAGFARWIKPAARAGDLDPERTALVVSQPLPYLYLAREVFRSAGVPCQMFDTLPLAGEPYAAALDLVFTCVSTGFAREPSMALLRSPWFAWRSTDAAGDGGVLALDRHLAEAGYLGGDTTALERLVTAWQNEPAPRAATKAASGAATVLLALCRELEPLRERRPVAVHLDTVLAFLDRHDAGASRRGSEDGRSEHALRARRAVHGLMTSLRDAFARFDDTEAAFDDVVVLVRRAIEARTFAPRTGEEGVHVIDADSARFGDFDDVQLAGLIDGEWPGRSTRNIFYGPEILRELGWPSEVERRDAARARFADLLRLPVSHLRVSAFTLEGDSLVSLSPLLAELEASGLATQLVPEPSALIFEHEALTVAPTLPDSLDPEARDWARHRQAMALAGRPAPGRIDGYRAPSYSLSALERYQDCGFRFFAANVLRLEESPEDQSSLTPRRRGQLLHEILQRFFTAWDEQGAGSISADTLAQARDLFAAVAEPVLAALPEAESALERARLFGSPISVGIADVVLTGEALRNAPVLDRWLEYRLEGEFSLGATSGRTVPLRGIADRVDLLPGRRLRVIDYKSGGVPAVTRALQAPIYALCAQERLTARDRAPWTIEEASYIALAGRRPVVPVVAPDDSDAVKASALTDARTRLLAAVDGIAAGEFAPRPYDTLICRTCAFSTVCRKEYPGDA